MKLFSFLGKVHRLAVIVTGIALPVIVACLIVAIGIAVTTQNETAILLAFGLGTMALGCSISFIEGYRIERNRRTPCQSSGKSQS